MDASPEASDTTPEASSCPRCGERYARLMHQVNPMRCANYVPQHARGADGTITLTAAEANEIHVMLPAYAPTWMHLLLQEPL